MDVGLSGKGTVIEATVVEAGKRSAPTVVLVGGLNGESASISSVRAEAKAFEAMHASRRPFRLIAIPQGNPDGAALQFPPTGVAYRDNPGIERPVALDRHSRTRPGARRR